MTTEQKMLAIVSALPNASIAILAPGRWVMLYKETIGFGEDDAMHFIEAESPEAVIEAAWEELTAQPWIRRD